MDQIIAPKTTPPRKKPLPHGLRLALMAVLFCAIVVSLFEIQHSAFADKLKDRKALLIWANEHSKIILNWVADHEIMAPSLLIATYVLCTLLMLPVWPCQLTAGYCFGLFFGILWCQIGAVIGGIAALKLSHVLVGHWFRERYESRFEKLQRINDKLGHGGLYVVMGIRLCHMLPFGLSNYLFGLTTITLADVALGTFGGGMPAVGIYVILGAGHAKDWRVWTVLVIINLLLLIPLARRYYKSREAFNPPVPSPRCSQRREG